MVIGIGLLAWLVLGGDDDEGGQADEPQPVSIEDLQEEAGSRQVPVFWAGPQAGATYEFTEASDGSVYVRYLPRGSSGDHRPGLRGGVALRRPARLGRGPRLKAEARTVAPSTPVGRDRPRLGASAEGTC